MESSSPLLKISFLIPSLFFLSLYDYLSQMDRETKKDGFKWQIWIAKIVSSSFHSFWQESQLYILQKSFVDYEIFKFKF